MSFGRTKCDPSVVSDLKTARIPCYCRQRRRGSDTPLIYGKTAVDLHSVSGSTLEVKFIDRDSHWYARRVKEAIQIRLHPDNINRNNGIEIPEAWIPTIKKRNRRLVHQRTAEGTTSNRTSRETTSQWNNEDLRCVGHF